MPSLKCFSPLFTIVTILVFVTGCGSKEVSKPAPEWVKQPSRTVDNGYIVYVGSGDDTSPERAQLSAEGLALQDLANECSFAPKGTRVEDRYVSKQDHLYTGYAKVAVEFQECDEAKKTVDPEEVRKLASQGFTEQIKKFQEMVDEQPPEEIAEGKPLNLPPETPAGAPIHDSFHFFVVRQYVAYEKEIVILSPPGTYAPSAPATEAYAKVVKPSTTEINHFEQANPEVKTSPKTWSQINDRPLALRPRSYRQMKAMGEPSKATRAPHHEAHAPAPPPPKKKGRRRKHF